MRPDKPLSPFEFSLYRNYRIVHGVRIALAFVLAFLLVRLLDIPENSWPLITLVVVMGPISSWGNVFPRALQRIGGTIFGSISGLVAMQLELISLSVMLLWCAVVMFICGFLTLGKYPYMALLIGITLAVICGGAPGDMDSALWRCRGVIFGSLLALLFSSIWPQKAYIQWRIKLSDSLLETAKVYHAGFSPNLVQQPRLTRPLQRLLGEVVKMRALLEPASKETRIPRSVFEAIQTLNRNLICTLELQLNAWWSSRQSHLIMLNAPTLRRTQKMTENTLRTLSQVLVDGDIDKMASNNEELAAISCELRQLIAESGSDERVEAPIHGYVWLNLEMARQLERLSDLIRLALQK